MAIVYQRPHALSADQFHYCPGCNHGIIHRLIAEAAPSRPTIILTAICSRPLTAGLQRLLRA